ncbi:PadR family transcriptional regulator [Herbiconiux sp. KACC 21604]|uniref:PadR family transcriptional regulator n=1 Tax=unclassified Herbiconiux TaxID=2618217 RepID=UPI0014912C14|nr:PadR family transcriptional regulator [Herbiconiux sp. SALV-R1]QJU55898.1 PadR family transcriptional regulator [Herbiconiux sp. SALV-R1]WPO87654.1 PadR family transcriptional regulator [Herbiconiux sp. KACC 21604]
MSGSFGSSGFGTGAFSGGSGSQTDGLWRAMEQLRERFENKVGSRMGRGDVRAAVLALLAEKPMHGYQIIHEIEERSGGNWKPSAGSVYPTLQLLADEGLIAAEESNGRKTYALTEAGRATVAETEGTEPWGASGDSSGTGSGSGSDGWRNPFGTGGRGDLRGALPKAGFELAQAAAQVGRTGSPEQVKQAVAELEDARKRLYAILAQD